MDASDKYLIIDGIIHNTAEKRGKLSPFPSGHTHAQNHFFNEMVEGQIFLHIGNSYHVYES